MKKFLSLFLALIMLSGVLIFSGCSDSSGSEVKKSEDSVSEFDPETDNPIATIKVKDFGEMKIELYYDKAPNTVKNFIYLANKGFYNGLTFHRIYSGFMIQGGCPDGNGTGDPGYSIKGEFAANGFDNDLAHTRGVISMARSQSYDSAGSQFFIMHQDASNLDGQYAAFGMLVEGFDVLDAIAATEVTLNMSSYEMSVPVEDVIIESVTVDTHGIGYDEPEMIK